MLPCCTPFKKEGAGLSPPPVYLSRHTVLDHHEFVLIHDGRAEAVDLHANGAELVERIAGAAGFIGVHFDVAFSFKLDIAVGVLAKDNRALNGSASRAAFAGINLVPVGSVSNGNVARRSDRSRPGVDGIYGVKRPVDEDRPPGKKRWLPPR